MLPSACRARDVPQPQPAAGRGAADNNACIRVRDFLEWDAARVVRGACLVVSALLLTFLPAGCCFPATCRVPLRVRNLLSCRKRNGQHKAANADQSLAGVASKFADYAVSILEGGGHDCGDEPTETPMTAQRPGRSALDVLRWNSGASGAPAARRAKRQKSVDSSQLYLDFGQRNFYSTKCTVCDMHYCPGLASDEKLHEEFHKRVTHGIIYKGFKNQHMVRSFPDGSFIVCIRRDDPASQVAKADEVRKMAERELGGYEGAQEASSVTFLMISSERRAVGYLLAERIKRAYRVVIPENSAEKMQENALGAYDTSDATTANCASAGHLNGTEQDAAEPAYIHGDDTFRCTERSAERVLRETEETENDASSGRACREALSQKDIPSLAPEEPAKDARPDAIDDVAICAGRADVEVEEGSTPLAAASQSRQEGCKQEEVRTPEGNAAQRPNTWAGGGIADENSDDDLDGLDLDALEAAALPAAPCARQPVDVLGNDMAIDAHDEWQARLDTSSADHESLSSHHLVSAGEGAQQVETILRPTECSEQCCQSEEDARYISSSPQTDENRVQDGSALSESGREDAPLVSGAEASLEDEDHDDSDAVDAEETDETWDDSLMVSTEEEVAACGICQVWVHRKHRRKGVATRLLEAALECSGFHDGSFAAPYSQCAFSQVCETARGQR